MTNGAAKVDLRALVAENSIAAGFNSAGGSGARIIDSLSRALSPDEDVIAYLDRPLAQGAQTDAFAYKHEGQTRQNDAFAYPRAEDAAQTDAFAYDTERGRQQLDIMGYERSGSRTESDAFAYAAAPQTPETDALVSDAAGAPRDVDFLLLTNRRLIRGILQKGHIELSEVTCGPGETVAMLTTGLGTGGEGTWADAVCLTIQLPAPLCLPDEDAEWRWLAPEGRDLKAVTGLWNHPGR
jgi:hypothetical protein